MIYDIWYMIYDIYIYITPHWSLTALSNHLKAHPEALDASDATWNDFSRSRRALLESPVAKMWAMKISAHDWLIHVRDAILPFVILGWCNCHWDWNFLEPTRYDIIEFFFVACGWSDVADVFFWGHFSHVCFHWYSQIIHSSVIDFRLLKTNHTFYKI